MAQRDNSWWQRHKFKLNGLVLILPFWFLYESMNMTFPAALPQQQVGPFTVTPSPLSNDAPYQHDGDWVKDFMLQFCDGCVPKIRQAYMTIATEQPSLDQFADAHLGILHGDNHMQHVHALVQSPTASNQKLWLLIEDWQGQQHIASWDFSLPQS
ncbi:hypothetical protein [Rheinheimera sp.]|uniref:hypothetical protein n=1 Tax=Rheinheimera sp. TaxID=1869214 RepID=UPI00307EB921